MEAADDKGDEDGGEHADYDHRGEVCGIVDKSTDTSSCYQDWGCKESVFEQIYVVDQYTDRLFDGVE